MTIYLITQFLLHRNPFLHSMVDGLVVGITLGTRFARWLVSPHKRYARIALHYL